MEQLKAEAVTKRAQLSAIAAEGKQIMKEMESFEPGSKDFKDRGAKITEIKAKLEANKQNAEMEGQIKQVEILAVFHKEMKAMTEAVARMKGVTTVLSTSSVPLNTQDPDSVMAAMSAPVVWADSNMDLTRHVLHNLNNRYIEAGNPVAKNTAPVGTADEAPATAPAARPAPAPGNATTRPAPSTGRTPAPTGRTAAPTGDK
jgi:Skp family chaperone for outer membrane proteins